MDHDENYYVGVDVGTGSARACIIDRNGDIKAIVSKEIQTWEPHAGYYEQSTNDIWACISFCVKGALVQGNIKAETVRGIGFCATCSLAVLSSTTDAPISINPTFDKPEQNVILWLDHRPIEEAKKINATKDRVLKYVGGQMSVEMELPKILWLKNNMPEEMWQDCKFYDLTDALTHIATKSETRSFCSTVCKQGYLLDGIDGNPQGWRDEFFEAVGLAEFKMDGYARLGGIDGQNGRYLSAGEKIGTLCESAAEDLGLPMGTAVGSGVIDAYAGWIGTVGAKHDLSSNTGTTSISEAVGRLALVAGTSTCHLIISPDPHFVNGVWGPYRDVLAPGFWMTEGGQSATGKLLTHVLESHPAYRQLIALVDADAVHGNMYDFLNDHLREMARTSNAPFLTYVGRHFHFYGDLFGNRSPLADPNMTGSIVGLSSDRGIDNIALVYYGVLEFLALQTRHIIDTLQESGISSTSLYMSGSQSQNPLLMKLIANSCDMPVVIPQYVNAAVVHGSAMLGAKAASGSEFDKTEDLWSIMERMSKPGSVILPDGDAMERELLAVKYKIFLEQAQAQRRYRQEVEQVVSGWKRSV